MVGGVCSLFSCLVSYTNCPFLLFEKLTCYCFNVIYSKNKLQQYKKKNNLPTFLHRELIMIDVAWTLFQDLYIYVEKKITLNEENTPIKSAFTLSLINGIKIYLHYI